MCAQLRAFRGTIEKLHSGDWEITLENPGSDFYPYSCWSRWQGADVEGNFASRHFFWFAVLVDDRLETIWEVADLGLSGVHIQARNKERPADWETRRRFWADRHLRGAAQVVEQIIRGDFEWSYLTLRLHWYIFRSLAACCNWICHRRKLVCNWCEFIQRSIHLFDFGALFSCTALLGILVVFWDQVWSATSAPQTLSRKASAQLRLVLNLVHYVDFI